jgi:predicted nucleotidyltransferase component of viral defense system
MEKIGEVNEIRCEQSDRKLMYYAAKLQEHNNVLYVDCCNTFDPYLLYRITRDEKVLDKVYVSRPFTVYQLRELIFNKLEKTIQNLSPRALLVPKINCYSADSPLDEEEYTTIFLKVLDRIKTLTKDYNLLTMVSYGGRRDG